MRYEDLLLFQSYSRMWQLLDLVKAVEWQMLTLKPAVEKFPCLV